VRCPRCHAQARESAKFCDSCGTALAVVCPACGSPAGSQSRFCSACGTPLGRQRADRFASPSAYTPSHLAEKILTSRSALEGERKQVTVLFADLKSSMELLADRDPEEARTLLDGVLERLMEAVHHYEGTVNQVMGDGIMALFGAPVAHEDHAVRACYAALRMLDRVREFGDELRRAQGLDVMIRIGINSGEVVVRTVGSDLRMDYSAVGQTTHLAARMEQLARPGTALVSQHMLGLVEGYVEVQPVGPVPVKGLPEPVEIYQLVGIGQIRSRIQVAATRGLSPFVGREAELEQLREALRRAQSGRGQLVAVVGGVGMGKSRLFWEFTRSPHVQGCLVLEGDSVSYGRATPYLPIIGLLKRYFQIDERDDPDRIREKVTARLVKVDRALAPSAPTFLELLGLAEEDIDAAVLDPPHRRQRTLEVVKRLLIRESQVQPVVIVFENMQWVDAETESLLQGLLESLPTARVLVLVNYRPDYEHDWANRSYYTQVRLDPLASESVDALLQALLGADPGLTPLKALLIERTESNPFFLEESVRSLAESGVLTGERGAYRLDRPLTSIKVPATVQAVLAARIDRLPAGEKRLLQAASVIGKNIPFALARAVGEAPDEELRSALERLQAAEFVYETQIFPEVEYTFKHALTHQVAYGSVLQERRRGLHAAILSTMEALYPEGRNDHVEALAQHALHGEVWDKAVEYLRMAGAKAAARAANAEALACFEQGLQALTRLPDSRETTEQGIDVRIDMRPALLQLGRLREVLAVSEEAARLAHKIGDEARLGRVYSYLVNYHYLKGEPDLVIEYGERCLAIGEAVNDLALASLARGYMGYSYHAQGQYLRARALLEENVKRLEESGAPAAPTPSTLAYISSSAWLAFTLAELGEFEEATEHARRAQRAAATARNPYGQAIAGSMTGLVALRGGQPDRAVGPLEQSLEICRDKGLLVWQPIPSSLLGLTFMHLGRLSEALPLLEDGVTLSERMGVKAYSALWTIHLGEGMLAFGRIDRARELAQHALDLALLHKEQGHQARALRLLGEIAAWGGAEETETAEVHYSLALALAEELGMRPLIARIHLGLGRLYRPIGQRSKAEDHLSRAFGHSREMQTPLWLEQVSAELRELGQLFVVDRRHVALYEYLRETFQGHPQQVILDRRSAAPDAEAAADRPIRRQAATSRPTTAERRRLNVEEALRNRGFAVIPPAGIG
jgi:class 3 adenylate cyclase/tetratricopeptide (TPR) repeat protein